MENAITADQFKSSLCGELIQPGDAKYADACKVYNGMIQGNKETPWHYHDVVWSKVIIGVDADPKNAEKISKWCKSYWEALYPFSAGAAYVNFMMEERHDRVMASYGENYDRLVATKAKYDPKNIFRVNQNIKPAKAKAGA